MVSKEIAKYAWNSGDVRILLSMNGVDVFSAMVAHAGPNFFEFTVAARFSSASWNSSSTADSLISVFSFILSILQSLDRLDPPKDEGFRLTTQ
jgi:hypothetical protein